MMKVSYVSLRICQGILVILLLTGCGSTTIPYEHLDVEWTSLPVPEGTYSASVWFSDGTTVFDYGETVETNPYAQELLFHNLGTSDFSFLPHKPPSFCAEDDDSARYSNIGKLPDGRLGFTLRCQHPSLQRFTYSLYAWDLQEEALERLRVYPKGFVANRFSFSPDMSKLLQEEKGDGIFNKLHLAEGDDPLAVIPGFWRSGHPAWSPDGKAIAFGGSPEAPKTRINIFSSLPSLDAQLNQAWNLYLMDPATLEPAILLTNLKELGAIRWSPNGNVLAFYAEYRGSKGGWLFNVETNRLARFGDEAGPLQWSPDGRQVLTLLGTAWADHPVLEEYRPWVGDVPVGWR